MTPLRGKTVRRAFAEHRRIIIGLSVVLVLNVLIYAFYIYPLARRVDTVTERTQAAEAELAAAHQEHRAAAATLTGSSRAADELQTFYEQVLPGSLADARRLAIPRLDQMARGADLSPRNTTTSAERDRDSTLARLTIDMSLGGTYEAIRRFIHQVEQAPEFVVIERVGLAEDASADGMLSVEVELSTYFREGPG